MQLRLASYYKYRAYTLLGKGGVPRYSGRIYSKMDDTELHTMKRVCFDVSGESIAKNPASNLPTEILLKENGR